MKKILKTMGLGAAVIAATGVSQAQVQAEEVTTTNSTTSTASTATTVVTSTDVEQATQLAAKTEAELSVAEQAHSEAQENVRLADQAVSEAEQNVSDAEKLVAQATPSALSQAESSIVEARQDIETASTVVSISETHTSTATEAVENQKAIVAQADQAVNAAGAEVTVAQNGVDLAQATLDGTNAHQIVAEADQAEKELLAAEEAQSVAEENLKTALLVDQAREATINQASLEVAQKQDIVSEAQATLGSANEAVAVLAATKNLADQALIKAENDYQAINTITLTPEYIANLKAYADGGYVSDSAKAAEANLKAMNEQLLALNRFKANGNDSTVQLDTSNLSQEVRQELTLFAVDLLNQIRRQMGTEEAVANLSAIDFANAIANNYEADNYDMTSSLINPHDIEAIKKAAATSGLSTTTTSYENIHTYGTEYTPHNYMTISELKETVYDAFINFLFNGQEYFHAMSVTATPGFNTPQQYIGLAISNRSDAFSVHLIGVADRFITDTSKFNTGATIVPDTTPQDIITAYRTALKQANSAKDALSTAQVSATAAQSELSQANESLLLAQEVLQQAQTKPLQVPTAQKALTTAQENYALAQERNAQAQTALQNLSADTKVKQAALNSAKEKLTAKQIILEQSKAYLASQLAKLGQLEDKLAEAKQSLVDAKVALEMAQATLVSRETYLNKLKTAPEQLNVAQSALKVAQDLLIQKESELEVALEHYHSAKVANERAQVEKARLVQLYQTDLALQETGTVQPETSPEAIPLPTSLSLSGYSYGEIQVKPGQYGKKTVLPKTNSQSSSALLMLGLTSLLSTIGFKRKHK
ncbi:SEC10/PgrA surface exclusion domain-containing protein [Streptococcus suis]|uniref:SEC10/PgrA surface exclusion domain-containing protein n=1 Tax=Streptococcus suis TaxID=1307 RepID=UPI0005CCFD5E|nr:SEC10/PgrA surface exclusion domain-containing protein [Streptococcus suis]NQI06416.1 SEC10/PgrA surface exclusion domain-containing protein [Streptococcus suis]CYU24172.1 Putative transposon related peptidoglycan linked protein (LPXTG motif) [Streptococcus suis]